MPGEGLIGLSLHHGKVVGCSPAERQTGLRRDGCPSGSRVCLRGLHTLPARARQAEMYMIREKVPRNHKGAAGIGNSDVACRTLCKIEDNAGSLFKRDSEFDHSDSRA